MFFLPDFAKAGGTTEIIFGSYENRLNEVEVLLKKNITNPDIINLRTIMGDFIKAKDEMNNFSPKDGLPNEIQNKIYSDINFQLFNVGRYLADKSKLDYKSYNESSNLEGTEKTLNFVRNKCSEIANDLTDLLSQTEFY